MEEVSDEMVESSGSMLHFVEIHLCLDMVSECIGLNASDWEWSVAKTIVNNSRIERSLGMILSGKDERLHDGDLFTAAPLA